ncbi:TonB-dependent receptor [Thalassotalea maritima]|uniref:TonB-dependent receptor n=1 Tax=Thalassotalea maritima TaxID=3242416 RepID=UPI00352937FE
MSSIKFNKTKLATSLSLVLGASVALPTYAEEAAAEDVEVIEVTGIRGSLTKAMDIKRSASGIVEAINAEDIGKFPDTNLAESLQRISGIAIDRDNGEGSTVSARGFSADRNLVLLNGRQMPTTTGSRSFDFDNVASELISGAEVYKTSDATIATGGIGATINILTHRPLNRPGMQATVGVKGMDDTSTNEGGITPELSGLYSNTFMDDKFGISISGSYAERESGNQVSYVDQGWRTYPSRVDQNWGGSNADWGGVPYENQVNRPDPTQDYIYSVPQTTHYQFQEAQRKRLNSQLVLQYAPNDDMTFTVDYTYMTNKVDRQYNEVSAWYNFVPSENVWVEGDEGVFSPAYYEEPNTPGADLSMALSQSATKAQSDSLAFNFEWQVNDDLWVEFDHHSSHAEETPNSPYGSDAKLSTAAFVRNGTATDFTGDLPVLAVDGVTGPQDAAKDQFLVTGSVFVNVDNQADIDQTQFNGKLELDEFGSIDFGASLIKADKRIRTAIVQNDTWGGAPGAQVGDITNISADLETIHDKFDHIDGGYFADHPSKDQSQFDILDFYWAWDFNELRDFAEANYGSMRDDTPCGTNFCASTAYGTQTDFLVEEEIVSVYTQWNYQGEIGVMPFDVHVGLRYEETEVYGESAVPIYENPRWYAANESVTDPVGQDYLSGSGKYDHLLPNINFNLELNDDMIVRAAYSETIGRAAYGDLQGGAVVGSGFGPTGGGGAGGNPGLEPLESQNFDLSFEWYYDESSYAAIGYFQKNIDNYVGRDLRTEVVFEGLTNPRSGPKVEAARAAGATTNDEIRQYIYDNYKDSDPEHVYMDENGTIVIEGAPDDDPLEYVISEPVNIDESVDFDGWEFSVQHIFGDTGIGFFANYTIVDAGTEYNNRVISDRENYDNTALFGTNDDVQTGISDTTNLVLFYENYGVSARLAYNWREGYLESMGNNTGANPTYVEDYDQIDFQVSYDFADVEGLAVFFEGINITNEYRRKHGRTELDLINVGQQGARYSLGARYTF